MASPRYYKTIGHHASTSYHACHRTHVCTNARSFTYKALLDTSIYDMNVDVVLFPGLSTEGYFKFKVQYKTGDKNAQLVLRLCSKTRWIAMLHVLPHTFEAALQQIRLQGFYYWVKGATSLFNSFGAKSQNKLRVFVARFMLYLNFKVTFCRQAEGKAPHSYSRWLHLIEPQERTASVLFIWMVSVNFHPQTQK